MTADRLTMRLDPETREWLDGQAKLHDRSAAYVAKKAIRELRERTEAKAEMIRAAIAQADKGVFISEDEMNAWMDSWDTDDELAPPEPDIFPQHP